MMLNPQAVVAKIEELERRIQQLENSQIDPHSIVSFTTVAVTGKLNLKPLSMTPTAYLRQSLEIPDAVICVLRKFTAFKHHVGSVADVRRLDPNFIFELFESFRCHLRLPEHVRGLPDEMSLRSESEGKSASLEVIDQLSGLFEMAGTNHLDQIPVDRQGNRRRPCQSAGVVTPTHDLEPACCQLLEDLFLYPLK